MNSLQNATVVLSWIKRERSSLLYPVSSSSSRAAQTLVSSVTLSLDPAGISSVMRSIAGRYWRTMRILPSSLTGTTAAAPFLCDTKSHSSTFPSGSSIVSV